MNGQQPFEGDSFIAVEILKLKERFNLSTVIETGSQYGATLQWLTENFTSAIGCDINPEFVNECKQKGLDVIQCESVTLLNRKTADLYYLDAHWTGLHCPLKLELAIIAEKKQEPEPVICIHDFKVPNRPDLGFDFYEYEFSFEEIEPYLKEIYPNGFEYHYNEKAAGAMRGIIYIYPKK